MPLHSCHLFPIALHEHDQALARAWAIFFVLLGAEFPGRLLLPTFRRPGPLIPPFPKRRSALWSRIAVPNKWPPTKVSLFQDAPNATARIAIPKASKECSTYRVALPMRGGVCWKRPAMASSPSLLPHRKGAVRITICAPFVTQNITIFSPPPLHSQVSK